MSDIKTTENYFFLVFCWFSAQKTNLLFLSENQEKTTKIVFSIFYVWHVESELFFDLGLLFPWFSEIQKMILTVPKLSCKPRKQISQICDFPRIFGLEKK